MDKKAEDNQVIITW